MTLYTADYLEYYLTLIGWVISNGIWNVLVSSGVFALPFIAIIVGEWLKARSEGVDEGNKGALSAIRIENKVWVAIVVIMFAGIPFFDVDFSTIKYDDTRSKQCQVNVVQPEETGWSHSFTSINNQIAKVPIWWYLMHAASRAITSSAVASIPCETDLRQMRIDIDHTRIDDQLLSQEIADFTHDCYARARAKLFMNRPILTKEMMNDVTWIGSHYFLNNSGYYDAYRSSTPRVLWPYNTTRDAGLAMTNNGGGYPSCTLWWQDANQGLRARIIKQIDPDLLTRFGGWIGYYSQDEVNDDIVRVIASPKGQTMNRGDVYTNYGGQIGGSITNTITDAAGKVGMTFGTLEYFPSMDVLRKALPLVLSFLKMALVICIPIIFIIGSYELKTVVTISCVEFALFFVDFWFQLARWIDSTILNALYGADSPHTNSNILLGINNGFGDMLLNFVMGAMFVVLPMFWIGTLGWVGVKAGNITQMMTSGTGAAKAAGSQGAGSILKVAKIAISKGTK